MSESLACETKSVVRVEAKTVSRTSLAVWKHIGAGRRHALLRFYFVLIEVSGDPQLD